jgi:hypothetical protein
MDYEWDVFVSYPRRHPVGPWVNDHLFPLLQKWLNAALQHPPRLFFDTQMEQGTHWPSTLAESLLRSRCMLAVWAPPYFGSPWCLAEWHSMLERQKLIGLGGGTAPKLIVPVRFFDGDSFPQEAREIQDEDYRPFNAFPPGKSVVRSRAYRDFESKVQALATVVAQRIHAAPPWCSDWPLLRPPPPDAPTPIAFHQVGLR